ncbi:hypothetical protein MG293_019805 [Ovis ammon polii]|uniref:Uncharacterized protein n=1 Tax=Ovis ammon polii TaxID=230172 RepID=A0AAD4TPA8_OVIAM|nr:hypothetical protein MG293_019805 [Ovis ammon polii]
MTALERSEPTSLGPQFNLKEQNTEALRETGKHQVNAAMTEGQLKFSSIFISEICPLQKIWKKKEEKEKGEEVEEGKEESHLLFYQLRDPLPGSQKADQASPRCCAHTRAPEEVNTPDLKGQRIQLGVKGRKDLSPEATPAASFPCRAGVDSQRPSCPELDCYTLVNAIEG